ncbi:MAG: META domain-containing protein [Microbacteriaceae bacterium]
MTPSTTLQHTTTRTTGHTALHTTLPASGARATFRRSAAASVLVAVMVVLAACSAGAPAATGTWGDSSAAQTPYLTLKSDGSLGGSDGCNRLIGTWKQSDADITFGKLGSTMMACEGVDTWLSKAASATVAGSTLTVKDESNNKIGTLDKSK